MATRSTAPFQRSIVSRPRIVAAEAPDVPFQVAAGVTSAAVVLVLDVSEHGRAGSLRPRIVRVTIGNNHIRTLRLAPADVLWMLYEFPKHTDADRRQHDHSIAERQLRVCDPAVSVRDGQMALEPEGLAQPLNCGRCISIAHGGNDSCPFFLRVHRGDLLWMFIQRLTHEAAKRSRSPYSLFQSLSQSSRRRLAASLLAGQIHRPHRSEFPRALAAQL